MCYTMSKTLPAYLMEVRRKNLSHNDVPPFQVTEGHRNQHESIYYCNFPLVIYNRPTTDHFRDKRRFRSRFANVFHPRALNAHAEGFPWSPVKPMRLEKLRWCPVGWSKKFDAICIRFGTAPLLHGQTDRQTETVKQYRALHLVRNDFSGLFTLVGFTFSSIV